MLLSANAFSIRSADAVGIPEWRLRSSAAPPPSRSRAALDSAGYVAIARYRFHPWSSAAYVMLAAAAPWRWFSAMDLCGDPEIVSDEASVLDRIAGTVRLFRLCQREAAARGIGARFVPVVQGWCPDHYLRCLDRLGEITDCPLIGLDSVFRRPLGGRGGILRVVDVLDRALGAPHAGCTSSG